MARLPAIGLVAGTGVITIWCVAAARQLRRSALAGRRLQEMLCAAVGDDARVVITGADSGIGRELARQFATHPAVSLFLGCRHSERGDSGRTKVRRLELLEFDSVQRFAEEARVFLENGNRGLRLLVNNAGVKDLPGGCTSFGISLNWQVNFLGPFLLTELLARYREAGDSGQPLRVVNVVSNREQSSGLDEHVLEASARGEPNHHEYADSKRAVLLWTSVRAQSLAFKSNVFVHGVMPGRVDTRFGMYSFPGWLWPLTKPLRFLLYRSTAEGAFSVAAAGLRPQAATKFGQYFGEEKLLEDLIVWRMPEKKLAVRLVRWASQVTALEARCAGRPLSKAGRPLSSVDMTSVAPREEDRWSSAERRFAHAARDDS